MDKRKLILTGVIAVFVVAVVFLLSQEKAPAYAKINPAFRQYISAFSSGILSQKSTIKVQFAMDMADTSMIDKQTDERLFSFSPRIKGEAYWLDSRTIEFRPEEKLPPQKFYRAEFYLSKVMDVPDSMRTFVFNFQTMQQAFDVEVINHTCYDPEHREWERLQGVLTAADDISLEELSEIVDVSQNGKALNVSWVTTGSQNSWYFYADSIQRGDKGSDVIVSWNGESIDAKSAGSQKIAIPSLSTFNFVKTRVVQAPEQYLSLYFSDPLDEEQDVEGLIQLNITDPGLIYIIEKNEIRVYPSSHRTGVVDVKIHSGLVNYDKKKLGKGFKRTVVFEDIKPAIKWVGEGNILPGSNQMILPFEAVSLRAVDVRVLKIYENNVSQFLQVNELKGSSQLSRVGKVVFKQTIPLQSISEELINMREWNRYSLDLSKLIETEPGAIYRVTLNFRKEYSLYPCEDAEETSTEFMGNWNEADNEEVNWDYYGDYYYYDDYDNYYYWYSWDERQDPCSKSYYYSTSISRNILASDIGLMAKANASGEFQIITTNMITAEPWAGVEIEFLDYQQQIVGKGTTDGDGIANVKLKKKPFLLIAKSGDQRAYLKLGHGSSLSLSRFEVGGASAKKGIKGFVYGERGVWRPGDTIFLTFILEDLLDKIPDNAPVIMDVTNPRGQKVKQIVQTKHVNNFYDFRFKTGPDDPTGTYSATIRVGGNSFYKALRVETIKPNRLKIMLDFDGDAIYAGTEQAGTLKAEWLHGAKARKLMTAVDMTLQRSYTQFEGYDEFVFDDPSKSFYSQTYKVFSDRLDENGTAQINPEIYVQDEAPGMLKAYFETKVFEEGGGFSIDRTSLSYYPFKEFIGIKPPEGEENMSSMLMTDQDHKFEIVCLTAEGKKVKSKTVEVNVYKVDWQWWWDHSSSNLSSYVNSSYNKPIYSEKLICRNGKGSFVLNIEEPDWGRYFIHVTDLNGEHSTGMVRYFDLPGWQSRGRENAQSATMLSFTCDKEKYEVGDEVVISIPSPADGRALLTIETGSNILDAQWIDVDKGQTEITFKATSEMAPNVYAYVTLLQPHSKTENDLPIRMYGVVPIFVEDPNTHLRPEINVADVLVPEKEASITVSEENGKPMTFTLAVVDEGLLALTRYRTPNPWDYFYAKEALGIKSWDIFDQVIGAYGGKLERILSIGGGGMEGEDSEGAQRANRFKPMVKFFGPYTISRKKAKTIKFMMPQYIGAVRCMVIAGQDGAYGNVEKTVKVKKPLMVLGTLPRVVGPGEDVTLPATVFAMDEKVKNVKVTARFNDMFSLEGSATQKIRFEETGDQLVNFKLKVKEKTGVGKVELIATSGNERAVYEIEIDVRNPNPPMTEIVDIVLHPGQKWEANYSPLGMKGTNEAFVEMSSIPPIDFNKRLKYLISYPHGCVEQTVSSAFPQLYIADVFDLDEKWKKASERNVKAAINKLRKFQASSGGFSSWPGRSYIDDWGTSYAGHFLLEAKKKGYNVPSSMIKKWRSYQKKKARQWVADDSRYQHYMDMSQAYRLYTLSLAKSPELGAMNRLKEKSNLSVQTKWRLAAAYYLSGQSGTAKRMVQNINMSVKPYSDTYYTYGSSQRDKAMIIETLCLLGQRNRAATLVKQLSKDLSSDTWYSTQTTAYSLISISQFLEGAPAGKGINCKIEFHRNPYTVKSAKSMAELSFGKECEEAGITTITNKGKGILYVRLVKTGIPKAGEEKATASNLRMDVKFQNMNGASLDPTMLEQGQDFIAEVTISNPGMNGRYANLALSQIFPSGWEIHNTRMDNFSGRISQSYFVYQDVRDDRVYTYFSLNENKSKTYRIMLNASYQGVFYLPSFICEDMYDNSIYASSTGQWVRVLPFGKLADKQVASVN